MKNVEKLFEHIYLIDGHDLNMKERTGTYVLAEEDLTIIETSASPSVPYVIDGLKELGYTLNDIKYIIVTHIHLDHAGGAGLLLEKCPNAKVVVHPKGARHLADPSRLIAGARAVYGDKFDRLFDPILPIPEERLIVKEDRDTLSISENCTLTFYDTPGHANHHFSIYHPRVNGMFTGDTVGVSYPSLLKDGVELYLPTTSPNQFDPKKMLQSMELYKELAIDHIFFGHYGLSKNPEKVYEQVTYWIEEFVNSAEEAFSQTEGMESQVSLTVKKIYEKIEQHLQSQGITREHPVYEVIQLDIEVCSMGLIDYLIKRTS